MEKINLVNNFVDLQKQIQSKAQNILLASNDNINDSTTISYGFMAEAQKYASELGSRLNVLIQPRIINLNNSDNYVFNDIEINIMESDIFQAQRLGIDRVSFAVLDTQNQIDEDAMEQLISASDGMQVCFTGIDSINEKQQAASLDWLKENGVDFYIKDNQLNTLK